MTPCWPGVRPVVSEVRAVDVVEGATVRMGPPAMADRVGADAGRATSCSQPSPSSTSSSTWSASAAAAGNHSGQASGDSSSVGTTLHTHAPA